MTQKNEVLTRETDRISFTASRRSTTQRDYLTITETEIPLNAIEQSWILEVRKQTRVGRTTPSPLNTFVRITKWLKHLGSGKIDDGQLEARHNIHSNFRAKGIGL